MKKIFKTMLFTAALFITFIAAAVPAQAGAITKVPYYGYQKIGNAYFKCDGNTLYYKKGSTVKKKTTKVIISAATDGTNVYYKDYADTTFYKWTPANGAVKKIGSIKPNSFLSGGTGSTLFYNHDLYELEEDMPLYKYTFSTGKSALVRERAQFVRSYGDYAVIKEEPADYDFPSALFLYNVKTGKMKKLSAGADASSISGGKLYYGHVISYTSGYPARNLCIRCYDMRTGKTKILVKSIKNTMGIAKITPSYVVYSDGNSYKYFKYTYATKKTKIVKFAQKADGTWDFV